MPYRVMQVFLFRTSFYTNYVQMLADEQQLLTVGQVSDNCRRAPFLPLHFV